MPTRPGWLTFFKPLYLHYLWRLVLSVRSAVAGALPAPTCSEAVFLVSADLELL